MAFSEHKEALVARLGAPPVGHFTRLTSERRRPREGSHDLTLVHGTPQASGNQVAPVLWSDFSGFPESTLLESGEIPIAEIAALALREGQCTNPLYRVHRWFARRLGPSSVPS